MLSAGLAFAASLTWGGGDFLGGIKSRVLPALVVMGVSQPFGLAVLAVMVAVRGTAPPGPEVWWSVLSALLATIGLAAFYRGMAVGAMSVVAPIAAVAAGFPVIWGLVQGDRVSIVQEAGFVLALGGSLLASLERGATRTRFAAGAGWGLLAMFAFGGYFVPLHAAAQHDWLWPSLIFRVTSVAFVWSALLVQRVRLGGIRPHLAVLAAVGLLDTGGNVFFAAASSTHGLLSVVSVLASLYPVVTVLLARFALGERVQASQNAGVIVTLAGVVMISAG